MKNLILAILIPVFYTGNSFSQEARHHPTRILFSFSQDSPVYAELFTEYGVGKLSLDNNLKREQQNSLVNTVSFFSEYKITSLEKLAPVLDSSQKTKQYVLGNIPQRGRIYVAEIENPDAFRETMALLRSDPQIEHVEPDFIAESHGREISSVFSTPNISISQPNDPFFSYQWGLENTGQSIPGILVRGGVAGEDINVKPAWEITTGSEDVILAIIDSGFPKEVNDFSGRVLSGYDFVSYDSDPSDDRGHGTRMASIALSTGNNGNLISGVDWNAKLLPVKVLGDDGFGLYSWIANGISWAVDQGADVINLSLGGNGHSKFLVDAVFEAIDDGVHVVASMGNDDNGFPQYPASIERVVSVGAINVKGERASPFSWGGGSNYASYIDIVSPGDNIAGLRYDAPNEEISYGSGTSPAAAFVSGTISLMLSVNPNLTPVQSLQILRETARGDGTWNKYTGMGVVDAAAAVQRAKSMLVSNEVFLEEIPVQFTLSQNYPNPFNPTTNISFTLANAVEVNLTVYNLLGQKVGTLISGKTMTSGVHSVEFDATRLTSGIYVYRLEAGSFESNKRMMLIK